MRLRVLFLTLGLMGAALITLTSAAWAATTPGWECVPTTAGQAVVSGGTGATPSCAASTTPVLAPTYVSSGVGGKPTVQLSTVNLQVIDGSGATSTINGTGNIVIGYAENANNRSRTGSHNLILGTNDGYTSYGSLAAGSNNVSSNAFTAVFGATNTTSGQYSFAAGHANTASGPWSSATGGEYNTASGQHSMVAGGEYNQATSVFGSILGGCADLTGSGSSLNSANCSTSGLETIGGGVGNVAYGNGDEVAGGDYNTANGTEAAIAGGESNTTSNYFSSIAGGQSNTAGAEALAISGGLNEYLSDSGYADDVRVGASTFTP